MATSVDIVPALGHGLVASQVGPSAGYDAIDIRRAWGPGIQEGIVVGSAYLVQQRAAGANLSVDVGADVIAGNGPSAFVQGDSVNAQGLYAIAPHTAAINLDIAAANATNPRVDIVILEVKDDTHDVGGLNVARVRVISGTATSGATLDNRTGAPALPSSALLLADVLIPATDTTISNSQIRDRRKWACGAYARIVRTAGSYTTSTGTLTAIDLTNLNPRIECSGALLRVSLFGLVQHSGANTQANFGLNLDGAAIDSTTTIHNVPMATLGIDYPVGMSYVTAPAAGSHLIAPMWASGATATLKGTTAQPLIMVVEEIVRQNSPNNVTTTG